MGKIQLPNMRFYTYNGVFDEEKKMGQQIAVDVTLHYPIETAVVDDDLNTTISYVDVYEAVATFVQGHQFNLMESLANGILWDLLAQFPTVEQVAVTVHKDYVPMPGVYDPMMISVSGTPADLERRG